MTEGELLIHPVVSALGPDILADDFDIEAAIARLRRDPQRDVATALLDQRSISGIGNVFKCEALFLERVSPWARVADLDDDMLRGLVSRARTLMRRNLDGGPRRTHFSLDRRELMWVDERTGRPCRVCGTAVAWGWHPDEVRKSWYCPTCQPTPAGVAVRR
jgi:endonuclease-8